MSDHKRRTASRTVGVRELKAHATQIVREVRETGASYVLTHRGEAVGVIVPVQAGQAEPDVRGADAWQALVTAGRRLERKFRPSVSGVALLSESRR